jgi:hypothetical protein
MKDGMIFPFKKTWRSRLDLEYLDETSGRKVAARLDRCFAFKHPDVAQHGDAHGVRVGFDLMEHHTSAAHVDSDFDFVDLAEKLVLFHRLVVARGLLGDAKFFLAEQTTALAPYLCRKRINIGQESPSFSQICAFQTHGFSLLPALN